MKDAGQRNSKIQACLKQFTTCGDTVFNCSDKTLASGHFETKNGSDLLASNNWSHEETQSLLKASTCLKTRLNIAQQLLKKLLQ